MLRLVYYEIRKNFLQKTVLIGLVLALLINCIYLVVDYYYKMNYQIDNQIDIVTPYNTDASCYDYYVVLHDEYDGYITETKVRNSFATYTDLYIKIEDGTFSREYQEDTVTGYLFGDYYYMTTYLYNPLKYAVTYADVMNDVLIKIHENIAVYKKMNNKYEQNKQEYLLHTYENRSIKEFYETGTWNYLFDYDFSDLLVMLLMILGIISIFTGEKTNGMVLLIQSNSRGKQDIYIAKYIAIIIYAVIVSLLFSLFDYLFVTGIYGLPGSSRPLYCIEAYQYTILNCSLLSFYRIISMMKLFGFVVIGVITGIISHKSGSIEKSFLFSVVFMIGALFVSGYIQAENMGKELLAIISPYSLLKGNKMFLSYNGISAFGQFITMGTICILLHMLILMVIIFVNIWKSYKKH